MPPESHAPSQFLLCGNIRKNPTLIDFDVEVDNRAASENVFRFLENQGYSVSVTEQKNLFIITANGKADTSKKATTLKT